MADPDETGLDGAAFAAAGAPAKALLETVVEKLGPTREPPEGDEPKRLFFPDWIQLTYVKVTLDRLGKPAVDVVLEVAGEKASKPQQGASPIRPGPEDGKRPGPEQGQGPEQVPPLSP